jgi:hypothetical protein
MKSQRLPAVGGRILDDALVNFERRCLIALDSELQRPNPDNALIALLCDAVRLARETGDNQGGRAYLRDKP